MPSALRTSFNWQSDGTRSGWATPKRLFARTILLQLPEEGLDEAIEALSDIYSYYDEMLQLEPPEPPVTLTSKGRVVETAERPDLIITEEDLLAG